MKKFSLLLTLLLLTGATAFGQTAPRAPLTHLKAKTLTGASGASVALSWQQSTSPNITSNNVYRGLVSGGPYGEIYSSPNLITTYTDTSVAYSTTYYYVITVVCATCSPAESGYSNQATAVVTAQGQPAPPTGVTATPNP